MAFNDLSFVFLFFPVVLLAHWVVPGAFKNLVLLIFSLVFFAWGSPSYVLLMVLLILFNYFTGLQIKAQKEEKNEKMAKFALVSAVAANLLLLGFFKYWGFLLQNVNAILGTSFSSGVGSMPLGVSFFTFSILSYLYDIYRDKASVAESLLDFALFVTFFPKLVSGPIVRYADFEKQIHDRTCNAVKFGKGARLFLIGLAKKVLLSNILGTTFYAVSALDVASLSVVTAWLGAVCYALMLYFDFSGYSDMAIGLGSMFGFSFDKNFDYPYMSGSITEFWRRWHISLGAWFREYIYFPLGGSRVETVKIIRNLFVVWLFTGIWHGASWNFIVWGLYYGVLQVVEKFLLKDTLEKIPSFIRIPFTQLLVLIGWVFFFCPSLGSALSWLGRMVGIGGAGFLDATGKYYLGSSAIVLVIGAVSAFPLGASFGNKLLKNKNKTMVYLSVVWFAALLVLCIAGMMSSTYSSFLYFQF